MSETPTIYNGNGNGVSTHIRQATDVAGACRAIVKETCQRIGQKDYVRVEGWQAIAVAHGCVASARDVERLEDGYRCIGEVKRMDNGQVISQAEGFLGDDEPMWASRPTYAKRAMCQTRAISRACRSAFAHIVVLIDSRAYPPHQPRKFHTEASMTSTPTNTRSQLSKTQSRPSRSAKPT
jgi:hypothetical protein